MDRAEWKTTWLIDANGIVNVSAKDNATGKEQTITIAGTSGLSKDEVARMVADAESHAADDRARRDLIDARNQGDALIYSVERTLNEHRGKLPVQDVARVESAISDVREALKGEDAAAIKRTSDALQQASHAMAEQMYKQGQGGSRTTDGEVMDAEVVDA